MTRVPFSEQELHAYLDGELDGQGRGEVEAAIAEDQDLRRRFDAFQADKASISRLYSELLEEPLPAKWTSLIESRTSESRRILSRETIMALAAAMLLVIGGAIAFRQMMPSGQESIIEEALAARSDALTPKRVIAVNASERPSVADAVVASALRMRIKAPDLSSMGYTLNGVRVYQDVPGGKAVELLYRQKDNRVFALYLRHPSGQARFDQFKEGNLRVCIWQDDVLGTVMTGEMSAAEMQRLASLAYTGLEA